MRKWLIVGAGAVVLLAAGAVASYYFYERHQSRDIRGSSTVEFVPTEPPPKPPPKRKPKRGWNGANPGSCGASRKFSKNHVVCARCHFTGLASGIDWTC